MTSTEFNIQVVRSKEYNAEFNIPFVCSKENSVEFNIPFVCSKKNSEEFNITVVDIKLNGREPGTAAVQPGIEATSQAYCTHIAGYWVDKDWRKQGYFTDKAHIKHG